MRTRFFPIVIFAIVILVPGFAQAYNPDTLEFVSEMLVWGSHNDVTVVDTVACVANDLGLLLIDISEPSMPRLLGKYISEDFQNWGVCIRDQYAYLANRYNGMDVIDICEPGVPAFMGNWGQGLMPYSYAVCVEDTIAYLASLLYGLVIINVQNPLNPFEIAIYPFVNCGDVCVRDSFAYLIGNDKLLIVNIADPVNPESVTVCETPGNARRVCLSGDYAYIADGDSGLSVVDISDPHNPSLLGFCTTYDESRDVSVVGRYAYIADGDSGLTVVDVIDPENPFVVSNCATPGENVYFQGIFADSNYAYLADDDAGLVIIDITDSGNPVQIGRFDATGFNGVTESATHNAFAYVIDRSEGMKVLDMSSINAPQLVGIYEDDRSRGIHLDYPYAYVASENIDLMIIDVTDPGNPSLVGSFDTPIGAQDVHVVDTIAYFIAGSKLFIIDVSNPGGSFMIDSVELDTIIMRDIYVKDSYVFVACNDTSAAYKGMTIVDVSDPSSAVVLAHYPINYFALSVYVKDTLAYLGEGMLFEPGAPGKVEIVNVAEPSYPTYVGEYQIADGIVLGVCVDSVAYLAAGAAGVKILDVSVPCTPELICEYNTPGVACAAPVRDQLVYVGDHYSFVILNYTTTGIGEPMPSIGTAQYFTLQQNHPNPFAGVTFISYQLRKGSRVCLTVYDVAGELVRILVDEGQKPGVYKAIWDGRNDRGELVSAGVYFYQIKVGTEADTRKTVFLR